MTLQGDSSTEVLATLLGLFLPPFHSVRELVRLLWGRLVVLTSVTLGVSSSHTQPMLSG